jgi:hypothetical protein
MVSRSSASHGCDLSRCSNTEKSSVISAVARARSTSRPNLWNARTMAGPCQTS